MHKHNMNLERANHCRHVSGLPPPPSIRRNLSPEDRFNISHPRLEWVLDSSRCADQSAHVLVRESTILLRQFISYKTWDWTKTLQERERERERERMVIYNVDCTNLRLLDSRANIIQ